MDKEVIELLNKVQTELKAPKAQENKFGGYKYRSCEDILEALKELEAKHNFCTLLSDDIIIVADRIYVKATAKFVCDKGEISVNAYAREPLTKKGMDEAQITGATSSYARKYALNGLFAIDDTKDADATNTHADEPKEWQKGKGAYMTPEQLSDLTQLCEVTNSDIEKLTAYYKVKSFSQVPYAKAKAALLAKLEKMKAESKKTA